MAGQADFELAARMLRGALDRVADATRHVDVARTSRTITGGELAANCHTALELTRANLAVAVHRIEQLALGCERSVVGEGPRRDPTVAAVWLALDPDAPRAPFPWGPPR
jgi:hypothetical protein